MIDPALRAFLDADDSHQIVDAFSRLNGPIRSTLVAHLMAVSSSSLRPPVGSNTLAEVPSWVKTAISPEEESAIMQVRSEKPANRALELRLGGGLSPKRIGEVLGIPTYRVVRYLENARGRGVEVGDLPNLRRSPSRRQEPKVGVKLTGEQVDFVIKARKEGIAPRKVADILGVDTQAVCRENYNSFTKVGVPLPPASRDAEPSAELLASVPAA